MSAPPAPTRARASKLVAAWAAFEKGLTREVIQHGTAFRLAADGLQRTFQVELGAILWGLPPKLRWLLELRPGMDDVSHPSVEQLGDHGPWLVDRVIGAREIPDEMDTAGKVHAVGASVRRAILLPEGGVDVQLQRHLTQKTLAWASDGGERAVGAALTKWFPGMQFRFWDEAHAGNRWMQNSVAGADDEIVYIDALLVTRKHPHSLAKFLSTSDVFHKRCARAGLEYELDSA